MEDRILRVTFCGKCGQPGDGAFCATCGAALNRAQSPSPIAQSLTGTHIPTTDGRDLTPQPDHPSTAADTVVFQPSEPQRPGPEEEWHRVPEPTAPRWTATEPPRGRRPGPVPLIAAGVVVLAVLALLGWKLDWFTAGTATAAPATVTQTVAVPASDSTAGDNGATTDDLASAEASAASDTPTTDTSTSVTLSPEELRQQAFDTLEQMVSDDASLSPIRGQWVAQLASKVEGTVDKSQQAAPFTVPQILAEVMSHKDNPSYGSLVRVVHQGDWGQSTPGPTPMWVTFADVNLPSKAAVVTWCERHFPQRGQSLLNVCYPRQMTVK